MTGWPAPLLNQDSSRPLFRWFVSKPDARRLVRERCKQIKKERKKMRVETVNDRYLLCGHILHRVHLQEGQKWAQADGTNRTVTITRIDGDWITYEWYEDQKYQSHVKDWFSFQCRYCLVLNTPDIPEEIFFYPPPSPQ